MLEPSLPPKSSRNGRTDPSSTATQETRRFRKPRKKKSKSQPVTPNNEPSTSDALNLNLPGPSSLKPEQTAFEQNDDFIAFSFSDAEDEPQEPATPIREWDRGKRSYEGSHGKKRKSDEMERDDRNADARRRRSDLPRKAPWVVDVNWQGCNNVPEL
jgi:non-canonical poly(A) RNA polymerase PAPD5/7